MHTHWTFPYYDLNFVSECLRTTLRRLKIQTFSGGACPQTPLQIAAYGRSPPSTVILKIFSPKLKILDRTLAILGLTLHHVDSKSCLHDCACGH